jgi:hypothetical protein
VVLCEEGLSHTRLRFLKDRALSVNMLQSSNQVRVASQSVKMLD